MLLYNGFQWEVKRLRFGQIKTIKNIAVKRIQDEA